MRPQARRAVAGAVILGACALGGAAWYYEYGGGRAVVLPQGASLEVAVLEDMQRLPDVTLRTQEGELAPAQLRGRWSFVYFGYTNCPEACPTTMAILSHVQDALRSQGRDAPRILLVSVDPERDTPQVLARYVAEFGKDGIGASGAEAALRRLLDFFGGTVERKPTADPKIYTFDHTTEVFLVTQDLRWIATFGPAEDPEAMVQDTGTLMRATLP